MQLLVKGKSMPVVTHSSTSNHHRIPIHERVELPDELIPADSRVEIDAKITAGEFFPRSGSQDGWNTNSVRLLYGWQTDDG